MQIVILYKNRCDPECLRTMKNPDGSSESYSYDTYGRETLVVSAYKDSAFDSSAGNADATYYSYTAVDQDDTPINMDPRPRTVERKILGTSVSKTYYAYKTISGETGPGSTTGWFK